MDWWHPLAWDWATLVKSALGAGFGTAAMTGILSVYRDTHHRKSQAAYMAMRLRPQDGYGGVEIEQRRTGFRNFLHSRTG
jgi:hypothetical protein